MIWKLVQLGNVVEYLKDYLSLDFLPKFTRSTIQYIYSFMGRAVGCHHEIIRKRLHGRKRRTLDVCKHKSKVKSSECICGKCTSFRRVQKKRVVESDFLANLAYNNRISKEPETSMDAGYNDPVGEITLSPGETWWNKVVNQRYNMPPLYHDSLMKSTKSEYSSMTSGFRSATPEISSDVNVISRNVTPLSVNVDNFEKTTDFSYQREGSKSDSKILSCRQNKIRLNIPSRRRMKRTSMKNVMAVQIFQKKRECESTAAIENNKIEKNGTPSISSMSHGSDGFSTCVKCSRIISKAI